jgi:putative glutamine amidotransferase
MKRFLICLTAVLLTVTCALNAKIIKRVGLSNPTIQNIEKLLFLKERGLLSADSLLIIGTLHSEQEESFRHVFKYVEEKGYKNVKFEIIKNHIPVDSLFCQNRCTNDFKRIFENTDAMVFFGGDDIPPKIYGGKTFLTTEMIPGSQNWELSFYFHLTGGTQNKNFTPLLKSRPDYLITGICLGMQEMNVAGGGTLYQDIPFQVYGKTTFEDILKMPADKQHKNYWERTDNSISGLSGIHFHRVKIIKNGNLDFSHSGFSPLVASVHHQAVKKLAENYKISAVSTDGKIVEGICNTKYKNVYGIQFHTDVMSIYKDDMKFHNEPGKYFELDKKSREFNEEFWKDFSRRLNSQK